MLKAHIIKFRRELRIDVSLNLQAGASIALFGASGAGKSTVLACIAGVETPDDGYVALNAMTFYPPSLAVYKRPIGYLTQEPGLFPHLRVRENVVFGVSAQERRQPEHTTWIQQLRDRLQLHSVWNAPAQSISGGQARRVALARMLACRPKLVLLDEPFAGLDRQSVRELIENLRLWKQAIGFSVIAVDHQADVLRHLCPEDVIAIEAGRIVQRGPWDELYNSPATPLLRSLLAPL